MVQALVNISERANRVLNIIKAARGLKDKSQAIEVMAGEYEASLLERELVARKLADEEKEMKLTKTKYLSEEKALAKYR